MLFQQTKRELHCWTTNSGHMLPVSDELKWIDWQFETGEREESCIEGENKLHVVMDFDSWFLIPLRFVDMVWSKFFLSS